MTDADRAPDASPVEGNSRPVASSQASPHESLRACLARHAQERFGKPIADHNRYAFERVERVASTALLPLILDSGCGTGDSSRALARRYPDHLVVGVDRSADRLGRRRNGTPTNCVLARADLIDFWRLAREAGWRLSRHYLLYPNPEPKARHLKRRFHAHPVFPDFVALGGQIESRSNWQIYLQELAIALDFHGRETRLRTLGEQERPLTLFERKYQASGQTLWQLETVDASDMSGGTGREPARKDAR